MNTEMPTHYLKLKLDKQVILILLSQTHIILPIAELQTIPEDDETLEGILNYHGQALPVYSLSELIGKPKLVYDLNTPLLLCEFPTGLLGFFVSEVLEVITLTSEEIQPPSFNHPRSYVIGVYENEQWSAWVLDLQKLISEHQSRLEEIHE